MKRRETGSQTRSKGAPGSPRATGEPSTANPDSDPHQVLFEAVIEYCEPISLKELGNREDCGQLLARGILTGSFPGWVVNFAASLSLLVSRGCCEDKMKQHT